MHGRTETWAVAGGAGTRAAAGRAGLWAVAAGRWRSLP